MKVEPVILGMAVLTLALGLGLFFWIAARHDRYEYFNTVNIISWLLIALFPVLIIFSVFPGSTFDFTVTGASMTGAIAAFAWIWWFGTRAGVRASVIDKLKGELDELRAEVKRLKAAPGDAPVQRRMLQPSMSRSYRLKRVDKTITLFTGSIDQLKKAEIWVSSENTNMQMARFYDRSVSGTIRYLGARKDFAKEVVEDTIAGELASLMGERRSVQPTTVLATGAGSLKESHGVRKILHVAAVKGEVSSGYQPVENIDGCVTATLCRADELALEPPCRSIALPLFGTGTARAKLEPTVRGILHAVIRHLGNEPTPIEHVYVLTWSEDQFEACKSVLESEPAVQPLRVAAVR
jgi:O-acetyl-ADP-ribose deacetylase (regulator of RNase III)